MASLNWSYEGENGPEHWSKLYPIANGNNQSPIDIKTKETKHDASLKPFSVSYNPATAKEIVNVGHSFAVNFEDKDNQSQLLEQGECCTWSHKDLNSNSASDTYYLCDPEQIT
uniref:Carbonic anhydrase 1 n=1 Tax=Vombatus ursinus TaxID=29139 RepID=A0A4X2LSJ5_VOMUR